MSLSWFCCVVMLLLLFNHAVVSLNLSESICFVESHQIVRQEALLSWALSLCICSCCCYANIVLILYIYTHIFVAMILLLFYCCCCGSMTLYRCSRCCSCCYVVVMLWLICMLVGHSVLCWGIANIRRRGIRKQGNSYKRKRRKVRGCRGTRKHNKWF